MASTLSRFPGVALITGVGGKGIGAAIARGFARSGCTRLAITNTNAAALAQTAREIQKTNPETKITQLVGDVSDKPFVEDLVASAVEDFGRLDYAVNCAGIFGPPLRSHEISTDLFDRINNVNYKGSWLVSRAALSHMLKQDPLPGHPGQRGAIVNIASQLGIVARSAAAPYCASKAAVINMTRSDAIDYSRDGIRVNCVCPGVIATDMTMGSEEVREPMRLASNIAPMQRMGTPDEVAHAVLFLCSSDASFVQGHALVVDGGYTIN
ncbi:hypothetical protein VSDG_09506 [Cytospora chrysosperma]|uniref:Uncharacterized protein n=1 Tax=Cytospora chrysosperma TaxID=252740 RepID=A0A423VCP3_CYTCH|nr:hypothetical protein VSDG_09506 [Valsa sordida]